LEVRKIAWKSVRRLERFCGNLRRSLRSSDVKRRAAGALGFAVVVGRASHCLQRPAPGSSAWVAGV